VLVVFLVFVSLSTVCDRREMGDIVFVGVVLSVPKRLF
jgi:hypothetical protein